MGMAEVTSRLPRKNFSDVADATMSNLAEVTQLYTYQSAAVDQSRVADPQYELGATENLFVDFLATCSSSGSADDANAAVDETLDHVAEFEQLLGDHITALKRAGKEGDIMSTASKVKVNLIEERNTWRLVGKLFGDRLKAFNDEDASGDDDMSAACLRSEKRLVERLFSRESKLREAQAIVDWLEGNAKDYLEDAVRNSDLFGDAMLGWENTLHALQTKEGNQNNLVSSLDPDARVREKRRLHELDEQDEARLTKVIFLCLRCGMLDAAQDLCVRLGVPWRAVTLIGWKLYHDPNYEFPNATEKLPVEGL
jgi:nuclear pore complex protein Nup107